MRMPVMSPLPHYDSLCPAHAFSHAAHSCANPCVQARTRPDSEDPVAKLYPCFPGNKPSFACKQSKWQHQHIASLSRTSRAWRSPLATLRRARYSTVTAGACSRRAGRRASVHFASLHRTTSVLRSSGSSAGHAGGECSLCLRLHAPVQGPTGWWYFARACSVGMPRAHREAIRACRRSTTSTRTRGSLSSAFLATNLARRRPNLKRKSRILCASDSRCLSL